MTSQERKMSILRLRSGQALGGELELLARDAAQFEKADQSFFDQIVRTRRTGGNADDGRTIRKPEVRNHFAFFVQIVMLDLVEREQARSVQDKIGRQFFLAHLREVRSVRAVVAANNEKQIHFDVEQFAQRILTFLSRAADRVEEPKILSGSVRAVAIDNRLPDPPLHFLGLAPQ